MYIENVDDYDQRKAISLLSKAENQTPDKDGIYLCDLANGGVSAIKGTYTVIKNKVVHQAYYALKSIYRNYPLKNKTFRIHPLALIPLTDDWTVTKTVWLCTLEGRVSEDMLQLSLF